MNESIQATVAHRATEIAAATRTFSRHLEVADQPHPYPLISAAALIELARRELARVPNASPTEVRAVTVAIAAMPEGAPAVGGADYFAPPKWFRTVDGKP